MLRSCTQNRVFHGASRPDDVRKSLFYLALYRYVGPRHIRCPIWNTEGIRMFDVKQLYIGGAIMAFAEVVTFVIMVATR